jgi:hypothetical protein
VARHLWRGGFAALVIVVAGCATPPQRSPQPSVPPAPQPRAAPPKVNLSGFSAQFKRGYGDGCDSARTASVRRDERSFKADADYAAGWNDGYSVCRKRSP